MSPLIQDPTVGRKLQRGFRLTDLPDSVLAPEIVGVVLLENWSAPLSDISRGCQGSASNMAVINENGIVVLVRVGSPAQYDLLVTEFWVSGVIDQTILLVVPTIDVVGLTVSDDTSFTDLEIPGRPTSQLGFDTQLGVPAGRIIWSGDILANTVYRMGLEVRMGTIGRGSDLTTLMIAAAGTDSAMRGGFKWTEAQPLG